MKEVSHSDALKRKRAQRAWLHGMGCTPLQSECLTCSCKQHMAKDMSNSCEYCEEFD